MQVAVSAPEGAQGRQDTFPPKARLLHALDLARESVELFGGFLHRKAQATHVEHLESSRRRLDHG